MCAGEAVTLPRAGRGGVLWKTREQEESYRASAEGNIAKGKALKCTQQAGDVISWCWGQGHAPKGCVLYNLCCAPCSMHHVLYI